MRVTLIDLTNVRYPIDVLVPSSTSSEDPCVEVGHTSSQTFTSEGVLDGISQERREEIEKTIDKPRVGIVELRERLNSYHTKHFASGEADKQTNAKYIRRLLDGEVLERAGNRDNVLARVVGVVGMLAPWDATGQLVEELFGPSLDAMAAANPDDPGPDRERVEYMLGRAQRRKQESIVEDVILLEDIGNRARRKEDPTSKARGKYSQEELDKICRVLKVSPENLKWRWVVAHEGAYYILVNGTYLPPVTSKDLDLFLHEDLAPSPVNLHRFSQKGRRRATAKEILETCAAPIRDVKADLTISRSYLDDNTNIFYEAVCPIRRLEPAFDLNVDHWLATLAGDKWTKLLDWIAAVTRLERQCAALYLSGPKGVGKNALARGLAQLWNPEGAPTDLEAVLGNFNADLAKCPLVFADEKIDSPNGRKKITGEMRKQIGSNVRPLMRKFLPNTPLIGALRLILAANNDRMLEIEHEDLGGDDLDAVASRFLHISCQESAAPLLEKFRAEGVIDSWFQNNTIARHALWLRDHHQISEGKRFIVEGDPSVMTKKLARQTKAAQLVLEWLAKYLTDPIPQPAQLGLIKAGKGKLIVATTVFADWWDKYVKSDKVPSTAKIGRALSNWSTGREVKIDGFRAHELHVEHIIEWAIEHNVGNTDKILDRVNGAEDNLKEANLPKLEDLN